MTTMTRATMRELHGSQRRRRGGGSGEGEGGQYCGFMIGSFLGAALLLGPLAASLVFMFTPTVCLLDFEF